MFLYHLVGLFHELVELLAGKRRPHQGCHLANCNAISHPGIFEVALNRNNIINATHTTNNTSPQMGLMPLDNVWFCKAHRPKNTTNKDGSDVVKCFNQLMDRQISKVCSSLIQKFLQIAGPKNSQHNATNKCRLIATIIRLLIVLLLTTRLKVLFDKKLPFLAPRGQ